MIKKKAVVPKNKSAASARDVGTKKVTNNKEELEEKEKVPEGKALDGEKCNVVKCCLCPSHSRVFV